MHLNIITPDTKIFEGEVDSTTFPGAKGSFQVLKNHAPIISALEKGDIKYKASAEQETTITISGGVVEVLNNQITVLVDSVIA